MSARKQINTFEIDGHSVRLTRIPVRRWDWGYTTDKDGNQLGHPRDQALYEVYVDEQLVGYVSRAHGWGKQAFLIERLEAPSGWFGLGPEHPYDQSHDAPALLELEDVAQAVVGLRERLYDEEISYLPTQAEINARVVSVTKQQAEDDLALQERIRTRDEEMRLEREQEEQRRQEVVEGLLSIDSRFGTSLSNLEIAALRTALERFGHKQ